MSNHQTRFAAQLVSTEAFQSADTPIPQTFTIGIGIEGTFAPQSGKDTLASTGHYEDNQWRRDFALVAQLGIQQFRYAIPWHRVEAVRKVYDWRLLDQMIPYIYEDLHLSLIADPLHHTSYPRWLQQGFLDPQFSQYYVDFVSAFAERYPCVTVYTPFNEPSCTLDFCGFRGFWHPYQTGDRAYVTMLRHTARAAAAAVQRLKQLNPATQIIHVDTFEHHQALDQQSAAQADFLNERRFLFEELIAGLVRPAHPLYDYLRTHGFPEAELAWFHEHPTAIDHRYGNYYPLNEEQLMNGQTYQAPSLDPKGFAGVVLDYSQRLPYPLSLGETNIQGTIYDRISWLKYMLAQAEQLRDQHGITLREFVWYPLFDCAGWRVLLQGEVWPRDPQGIFGCDEGWQRHASPLSVIYQRLVQGGTSAEIPAYHFGPQHQQSLGALTQQMPWHWQEQPYAGQA
jgi:hypothetical protein